METLEAELQQTKEENNYLRLMFEVLSSKYQKLQSLLQEIKADPTTDDLSPRNSIPNYDTNKRARIEFPVANKPLQIFVRTHPKDDSLVCP